jgi:hypothetical protein
MLGPDRTTVLTIPDLVEGTVALRIEVQSAGYWSGAWNRSVDLIGSGEVIYTLDADGKGAVGQWPAVTWESSAGTLDVVVNDATMGSTRMRRGLAPNKTHRFEWRVGEQTRCRHQATLPMNVKRRYTCDPATGMVTEG